MPNGLSEATRVFLEMIADRANLNVVLNGGSVVTLPEPFLRGDRSDLQLPESVAAPGWYSIRAEITRSLTAFNCLAVELAPAPAGAWATCLAAVFLEIQEVDVSPLTEPPERRL